MGSGDIVLMGPPGSGKGTQAKLLQDRGWVHLSTGELFRQHRREGTELGALAESYMAKGEYVPDDITVRMVRERLAELGPQQRIVFDGFPRTPAQATALDGLLRELGRRVERVVLIDCGVDALLDRIAKRGEGRSDDAPDVVRRRFDVYEEQTRPVVEHYERARLLQRIEGSGTVDEVGRRIADAVSDHTEVA